jgi:RNA-directed DNA polymerase
MMHDSGKSDRPVILAKPSNKADPSAAEGVEGRGLAKGNTDEQNAHRTQSREVGTPSALDRVRKRARQDRKAKFTTLLHHITVDRLREAFLQLRKKASPGVDGVTWEHGWIVKFIEHRIGDRRVLRLIQKWLNAGVMENGRWSASDVGAPQGATISPLLSNVYLHYVLDLWVQQWRRRNARGDVVVVRFADDFLVGFQHKMDATRFLDELRERLRKFALELHPEKTRLLEFGRFAARDRARRGDGKPETFNFLGFTHMCSKTKAGDFLVARHTIKSRMRATLRAMRTALERRRHRPITEQGRWLGQVVRGYFAYHAVPTNIHALGSFRTQVGRIWGRSLRRRSQRHRLPWRRMSTLVERWLPRARIQHPWPEQRFRVRTQGKSPVR